MINLSYYKKPKFPPVYTEEFRDPQVWQALQKNVLPYLEKNRIVRVWSAGCASGEETYSVAALLQNQKSKIKNQKCHISIYGTDIVINNLTMKQPALMAGRFNNIRFKVHDLVADPPLKYMNLILCRNVLMFFKLEYQEIICNNLYNSLRTGGVLVLGKAETLKGPAQKLFTVVDAKHRIYKKNR